MPDSQGQAGGTSAAGQDQGQGAPSGTPGTWDEALAGLPEPVRALYDSHITGLRNTVQATRQERDTLSGRLTELTKALGKDTPEEARRLLAEMAGELETTNRRATFAEEATKPEIGCTNPKVAFQVAMAEGLFDKRGNPVWAAIKAAAPELFRKAGAGSADGGAGGGKPASGAGMNSFIRRAAGR